MRDYDIQPFLPAQGTDAEWKGLHHYRRARRAEMGHDNPARPDAEVEAAWKALEPGVERRWAAAWRDSAMVGLIDLSRSTPQDPAYEGNRHLLRARGGVLGPHRRRGIGRSLFAVALDTMGEGDVLWTNTAEEAGQGCFRHLGAEEWPGEVKSRLDLAGLDWEVVHGWSVEGARRAPGVRMEVHGPRLPDAMLDEFAAALTDLVNDIPHVQELLGRIVVTAESKRREYDALDRTGAAHIVVLARAADGQIVGMTDANWEPSRPEWLGQAFTGVRREWRRRGLARWLKASMLEHVHRAHPAIAHVSTENNARNPVMLGINRALGFRETARDTVFRLGRAPLERYLSSPGQVSPRLASSPWRPPIRET